MNNNYTVYEHIFPNNKIYIGITSKKPEIRWNKGNGYRLCPLMNKAIKKYGWDNIKHKILYEKLTKEKAEQKEIELIKKLKSNNSKYGYNIENGGNCCGTHSFETKQKISKANKGKIPWTKGKHISKEHIQKMKDGREKKFRETGFYNNPNYRHSEETKKKISIKNKQKKMPIEFIEKLRNLNKGNKYCLGRFMSEETRKKIGNANRGRKLTQQQKDYLNKISKNKKKVNQYDLNKNFIKQWDCINEASRTLNIKAQNIGKVCKYKGLTAKGYIWRYADDNTN